MIKKFLVFTVLFTVAIGTAACGRENSPEETTGQSLKEETASETEGTNAHGEEAGSETEQSASVQRSLLHSRILWKNKTVRIPQRLVLQMGKTNSKS